MGDKELPEEIAPDPRECPYELPPLVRKPFANKSEKANAVRRVIEQAEQERASGS